MSNAKNGLTKEGRSVFWRWYFLGGAGWNYEKMQGLGYYFSMLPMIKKQKDEDLDFFDDEGYEEEPYINEDEEPVIADDEDDEAETKETEESI